MTQKSQATQPARFQISKKQLVTRQVVAPTSPVKNISGSTIDVTMLL